MTGHVIPHKVYYSVFAALMVLLVVTVAIAEVDLGPFNLMAAMIVSIAKTVLIVLFFMHVRYSSRITQIFAGAGFLWLAIMLTFTMSDYLTRGGTTIQQPERPAEVMAEDHV
jgi:cytochrome c oxidase subunit 4